MRAVSAPVSPALEKLRHGELTLEAYVEDRVELAMARVDQHMSVEQREQVRQVLREHVMTDPALQKQLAELAGVAIPES